MEKCSSNVCSDRTSKPNIPNVNPLDVIPVELWISCIIPNLGLIDTVHFSQVSTLCRDYAYKFSLEERKEYITELFRSLLYQEDANKVLELKRLFSSDITSISLPSFSKQKSFEIPFRFWEQSPNLRELHMGSQEILFKNTKDRKSFLSFLSSTQSLEKLCLTSCGNLAEVTKALKINKSIVEVDLSRNTMGERAASNIAEWLDSSEALKELALNNMALSEIGTWEKIGSALSRNQHVTTLDVSHNCFTPGLFSKAIENQSIKVINLENSLAEIEARQYFFKWVKSAAFEIVNLKRCYISDSIKSLASWIKKSSTLKSLNLDNNSLVDSEAKLLAQAFKKNRSLEAISIQGNSISEKGINQIKKCLGSSVNDFRAGKNTPLPKIITRPRGFEILISKLKPKKRRS